MLGFGALAETALAEIPLLPSTTTTKKKVGWFPQWDRLRHDPEELERRLEKQRGFNPKKFDEFVAATQALQEKKVKGRQKVVIEKALEAVVEFDWHEELIEEITQALIAAAGATRATATIKHAEHAARLAQSRAAYEENENEDEEEAVMLLLH